MREIRKRDPLSSAYWIPGLSRTPLTAHVNKLDPGSWIRPQLVVKHAAGTELTFGQAVDPDLYS